MVKSEREDVVSYGIMLSGRWYKSEYPATSIFKDPNVAKPLFYLREKCVVVPADKPKQ